MGANDDLSTGWEPGVPATDTVARSYVLDWAALNEKIVPRSGATHRDDDVAISDCGSPNGFLNVAVLLHPRAALDPSFAVDPARRVFAEREGGEFIVVSPWPTVDLRERGLSLIGHPPLMLRPAGGTRPETPEGLEIRQISSRDELRAFDSIETRAYGASAFEYPDAILDVAGWTMWLGILDGEPVATAAASLANGITRVEWIASLAEVRGRGIGAAMTWTATLVDPARDAVLISSDLGRPIYEAMGYRALDRFTLCSGKRDAG